MQRFETWVASSFLAFLAAVASTGTAAAQTAPTPDEIMQAWLASPHADGSAEAFKHWDGEGEVPGDCAVCHSTTGFAEYVAAPPAEAGMIDHPVPIGTKVECGACHAPGVKTLESVLFPSGETVAGMGSSTACLVCHQGRASTDQVGQALAGLDDDEVSAELSFINSHYAAAAATLMGSVARGGYQYEGRDYAGQFMHVKDLNSCTSCHDPHTTEVKLESCVTCHKGAEDFRAIRTTPADILGTGETSAGISTVIDALHGRLMAAMLTYSVEVTGKPVAYSDAAYPYFFNDLDGDGLAGADEAVFPNRYQSWTPRLLRAAYNYQYVAKDHGAFAHNAHYAIQLLYDSIESLAEVADVDMTGLVRP
ncbi:cytochrome c3 family protein [Frigidibacter sp. ROC022]|uniref:cytochrome c3 family protein n=1 Tax=Frigidibacter sp. ROC022 TaxID=2971796 RepID=UPI00215B6559|nr:cytochrome c3 family protein [Frigidibacter sp. ROC022]MCR8725541.1 cytochrome c3 family protein [Frigidibacter sp. ROC022]